MMPNNTHATPRVEAEPTAISAPKEPELIAQPEEEAKIGQQNYADDKIKQAEPRSFMAPHEPDNNLLTDGEI